MAMTTLTDKYQAVLEYLIDMLQGESDAVLKGDHGLDVTQHFGVLASGFDAAHTGFNRDEIAALYQKLYTTEALKIQDATALVTQNDAIAGVERAYQLRHRRRLDHFVSGTSRALAQVGETGFVKYAMAQMPLTGVNNG